jgi:hypothetical protein
VGATKEGAGVMALGRIAEAPVRKPPDFTTERYLRDLSDAADAKRAADPPPPAPEPPPLPPQTAVSDVVAPAEIAPS